MSETTTAPLHREADDYQELTQAQVAVLLVSVMVVALCGITYELIIAAVASYLVGNSVYQFSLTIGFFMFAMGIGSYLSKFFNKDLLTSFVLVEIVVSLVGGLCSITLFLAFSALNSLFQPIMYGFIIVIGALVGLEIPLLTRILSQKEAIRQSIAKVLSLDYVGALIGSVAFPLLLLPHVGLIRSSFVIGLINVLVAILSLLYLGRHLKRPRLMRVLGFGTLALLIGLIVLGSHLTRYAEHHLYMDQVVHTIQSPYQRIVFTENIANGKHRMFIDGHIQFAERDEYRYHESLVHPVLSLPGSRTRVLVLGGGDGLAVREILKYDDVAHVDLVDIDPAITDMAMEFPPLRKLNEDSLHDRRVRVINDDAFTFINAPGVDYDRVIIDMPDPHNEALNKLYSREFYRMIVSRMAPDAYLVTQSSSPFFTRRSYWSIAATLESIGLKTFSYHTTVPAFGLWGFHIAGREQARLEDFRITVPTQYLDDRVLAASSVFGRDVARVEGRVNSIMEPSLYTTYVNEMQH